MSTQQENTDNHLHGIVMTVPELPTAMLDSEARQEVRTLPPPKIGCLPFCCLCFSTQQLHNLPEDLGDRVLGEEEHEVGELHAKVRESSVAQPFQEEHLPCHPLPEPDPKSPALPQLQQMNATSGELVLPDTRRGSFAWSIPDKVEITRKDSKRAEECIQPAKSTPLEDSSPPNFVTSIVPTQNGVENENGTKRTPSEAREVALVNPEQSKRRESSYSCAGSTGTNGGDVEMKDLQNGASKSSPWADLHGYVEIKDFGSAQMSEKHTTINASLPLLPPVQQFNSGINIQRPPSPMDRRALPASKTPMITPTGTPRQFSPQPSLWDSVDQEPDADNSRVLGADGQEVDCRAVEEIILQVV